MHARSRRRFRAIAGAAMAMSLVVACSWDPSRPFDRDAPAVDQAIAALDAGDAHAAATTLQDYLSTGECNGGNIGTPGSLGKKPDGTFDLGLALFQIGEAFGGPFGDEEGEGKEIAPERLAQIDCAGRLMRTIADDDSVALDLRARAYYLEGNLHFLGARYEEAVKAYDKAIALAPGQVDAGDPVGRDAAWNRAIALRRIEDKKDAGNDAQDDAPSDAPSDSGGDSGEGDSGGDDGGGDSGGGGDDGGDDASSDPPPSSPPDAGEPPPPPPPTSTNADQDEKILDQLEKAPTVQQEAAKKAGAQRRVRGMADK